MCLFIAERYAWRAGLHPLQKDKRTRWKREKVVSLFWLFELTNYRTCYLTTETILSQVDICIYFTLKKKYFPCHWDNYLSVGHFFHATIYTITYLRSKASFIIGNPFGTLDIPTYVSLLLFWAGDGVINSPRPQTVSCGTDEQVLFYLIRQTR